MGVHRFFGGLVLPAWKPAPATVERLPLPSRLRVPLLQHAGVEAVACVAPGDRVARFACIARPPEGHLGAPVHAPARGVVLGFERGPVALPGTPEATHVLIEVDAAGEGQAFEARLPPLDPWRAPVEALRARIAEAGIVGLGGAGFPAAEKLAIGRRWLILNGAECEPVVASDEALLRERASEVLAGGRLMARLCGATRLVLAMEARMASALPAVRAAIEEGPSEAMDPDAGLSVELVLLPDRYPAGGERQLIQALTGEAVPDGGLPRDLGVLVHNVATAAAAWRAVVAGEPLVSRFVTVGGDGIDAAAVFDVAVGTPAAALGDALGGWRADAAVLRAGGPMMGVPLPHDGVAVGKTTFAVTAWREATAPIERPCIRCGDCATACPSRLQPQLIHARLQAGEAQAAEALGLNACIECGACDAVCPSAIPLTAGFRMAREASRLAVFQQQFAEAAKHRFNHRNARLAEEAEQAEAERQTRLKRVSGAAAAALAKAKARRRGTDDGGPASP